MSASSSTVDPQRNPLRGRRWPYVLVGLAAFLLTGLWFHIWRIERAERRLTATVDRYRAAGQPIRGADFDPPPVAPEDNAAPLYHAAYAAITNLPDTAISIDTLQAKPDACLEKYPDDCRRLLEANRQALELFRATRAKPRADWGKRLRSPLMNVSLPMLAEQRALAKLGCAAALQQAATGDSAEAVETINDIFQSGQKLEGMRGSVVTHLVMLAIEALACGTVERIAPRLMIQDTRQSVASSGKPVTRERLQALLSDLLDESVVQTSLLWAMYGDRAQFLDNYELIANGKGEWIGATSTPPAAPSLPERLKLLVFKPRLLVGTAQVLDYMGWYVEAAKAANWPAVRNFKPAVPPPPSLPASGYSMLEPSLDRCFQLHFRLLAHRRMAATALALRLYELDHGRRPAALGELVPTYLPAVPSDPFTADGRPLGYRPDGPGSPRLYSIGLNGIDESGDYVLRPKGGIDEDGADVPFFLNGDRPGTVLDSDDLQKQEPTAGETATTAPVADETDEDANTTGETKD